MFGVHDWTFLYNMFDVRFINNILITIKSNDFLGHSSRVGFVSMWKGLCYPKCANAGCLVARICTICDFHFFVKSSEQNFFSRIFYICCCYTFPVLVPTFLGVVIVAPLIFSLSLLLFTSFSPCFPPFSPLPLSPFLPFSSPLPAPPMSPPLSESSPSLDSSLVEGSVDRRTEVLEPKASFFFPLVSSSLESWKQNWS